MYRSVSANASSVLTDTLVVCRPMRWQDQILYLYHFKQHIPGIIPPFKFPVSSATVCAMCRQLGVQSLPITTTLAELLKKAFLFFSKTSSCSCVYNAQCVISGREHCITFLKSFKFLFCL